MGSEGVYWGAGMTRISSASGFIKSNMPLGQEGSLTDQQAWDVAAYIDSRERPRDPRQTGTVEEAKRDFHSDDDYYGQTVDGAILSGMSFSRRERGTRTPKKRNHAWKPLPCSGRLASRLSTSLSAENKAAACQPEPRSAVAKSCPRDQPYKTAAHATA